MVVVLPAAFCSSVPLANMKQQEVAESPPGCTCLSTMTIFLPARAGAMAARQSGVAGADDQNLGLFGEVNGSVANQALLSAGSVGGSGDGLALLLARGGAAGQGAGPGNQAGSATDLQKVSTRKRHYEPSIHRRRAARGSPSLQGAADASLAPGGIARQILRKQRVFRSAKKWLTFKQVDDLLFLVHSKLHVKAFNVTLGR